MTEAAGKSRVLVIIMFFPLRALVRRLLLLISEPQLSQISGRGFFRRIKGAAARRLTVQWIDWARTERCQLQRLYNTALFSVEPPAFKKPDSIFEVARDFLFNGMT